MWVMREGERMLDGAVWRPVQRDPWEDKGLQRRVSSPGTGMAPVTRGTGRVGGTQQSPKESALNLCHLHPPGKPCPSPGASSPLSPLRGGASVRKSGRKSQEGESSDHMPELRPWPAGRVRWSWEPPSLLPPPPSAVHFSRCCCGAGERRAREPVLVHVLVHKVLRASLP